MTRDGKKLQVLKYPNPILRKKSEPVTAFDDELRETAAEMFELMRAERGVGLAAPQVGIGRRFFVMNVTGDPADDIFVANPRLGLSREKEVGEEGCLSFPGITTSVKRAAEVEVTAQDLSGAEFTFVARELASACVQHETDHLNGVLLYDKMSAVSKLQNRGLLKKLEADFGAGDEVR